MTLFERKSIFLWVPAQVMGGDPVRIANALKAAGFESVMLHVENLGLFRSRFSRYILPLRDAGLVLIGSSAIYGAVPQQEGQAAGMLVKEFSLDGFVFDAEAQFERQQNSDSAAAHVMINYQRTTDKPSAWCSWAHFFNPVTGSQWHPVNVMATAMQYAQVAMPMQYWNWGDGPERMAPFVDSSMQQWRRYTDKPIIPAGRAYIGDNGTAKPETVTAYDARIRLAGCKGVTWWSMQHAINAVQLPGVWDALSKTAGFAPKGTTYTIYNPVVMG